MDMLHFRDAVIDGVIEQNEKNDGKVLPVERRMPNAHASISSWKG